jgi:hypothetical protein
MSHSTERFATPRAAAARRPHTRRSRRVVSHSYLAAAVLLALSGCHDELPTAATTDMPHFDVTPDGTQNITGLVFDRGADPKGDEELPPKFTHLDGIHVDFFDAWTAERLATTTTKESFYDSGLLPIGGYRVRFSDPDVIQPGSFFPRFFGTADDDFCSATIVTVEPGSTATANAGLTPGPFAVAAFSGNVRGAALDAETLEPIPGVHVAIRNAFTSLVEATTVTDAEGNYDLDLVDVAFREVRVRFTDPAGRYLPAYHAADTDLFCDGGRVDITSGKKDVNGTLRRVPPENLTEALIETIDGFDLPEEVHTMLVAPLNRIVALLADENANNDAAACAQLRAFLSRVDVQERRGQLTSAEADELRARTAALQAELGCS